MNLVTRLLILILIIPTLVKADIIDFSTNGFYYKLKTSSEEISIKGHLIDLSFHKKECNENLIKSLHDKILKKLRNRVLVVNDYYLVSFDGKEEKISKSSDLGKFLFHFPNIAKKNKEKEAFLCRKKK